MSSMRAGFGGSGGVRLLSEGRRRWSRGFRRFALVVLSLALVACGQGKPGEHSIGLGEEGGPSAAKAKRDPSLTASVGTGERTVWLLLKQQANLSGYAATSDWKMRGKNVYSSLTTTANASQANLRSHLTAKKIAHQPFWIVNAVRVTADDATIKSLEQRPDVARVLPDQVYSIPKPKKSAGQRVQTTEWGIDSVRAPEAWQQFGAFGDGIVVASIDTGVQYNHPALVRQYRGNVGGGSFDHNYNFFDPAGVCGPPPAEPCDNAAHGTHTMGTMVGDDLAGNQVGVAPHAKWIAAKGCEDFQCSLSSLLAAGQWILAPTDQNGQNPRPDLRPHIVNNSWGGGGGDDFYRPVVQAWVAAGIFPSFSIGNWPFAPPAPCASGSSPGDYPESYAVGAHDISGNIADFSLRGPSLFNGLIKPNVTAPGVFVRSSVPFDSYDFFDGTSMAAPHLSGTVALMWSAAPALDRQIDATIQILNESAVDVDDLTCGGDSGGEGGAGNGANGNNNVWGEGRLDAFAAVELSPRGPTGTLAGTVTDESSAPLAGVLVSATDGNITRSVQTNAAGAFSLSLPVGTYDAAFTAFGYLAGNLTGLLINDGETTNADISLALAPTHSVSGIVTDDQGNPLADTILSIEGTPIADAVTAADGTYTFPAVPEGDYTLSATGGGCFDPQSTSLTVDGDETVDFTLLQKVDGFGYRCAPVAFDFVDADAPLGLVGDDNLTSVPLPFEFPFYGKLYSQVEVSTNGVLSFVPTFPNYINEQIPSPFEPNASIFAFWDDLIVDGATGTVSTALVGSAPDRRFVVEWRDVSPLGTSLPLRFEAVLFEDGRIQLQYHTAEPDPQQRGGNASVGIEDESGTIGHQYSFDSPVLRSGLAFEYSFPPSGFVRGLVTNQNDGGPVAGATVAAFENGTLVRETTTDVDGAYQLQVPVGSYLLQVSATNYASASVALDIADGDILDRDFSLMTGRAELSPATIQVLALAGQTRTRTLTLSNTGSASFDFAVKESGGRLQTITPTRTLARNVNVDPGAPTTRELFEQGVTPKAIAPTAAGDVLFSFPADGMSIAWGVGYTGNVWLGDFFDRFNHEFSTLGAPTGQVFAAPSPGPAIGDMAYDSSRNLVCQVDVEGDNGIHCWDPATGAEQAAIVGAFPWTSTSQRGLAYRPDDDTFYIGGWNQGVLYHVAGLSHAVPGEVISACAPADGSISGLAYNEAMNVVWAATNSPSDTIYELNPDDCTTLSALSHPTPGFAGAGLDMDAEGNLWTVSQALNDAMLIESGVPAFSDVPWLTVDPSSGTVSQGDSLALDVTIDTAGLQPGQYLATLFVQTTAAREPLIRVPVSLVVTDYLQPVNSGGSAYTDGEGELWAADQLHTRGSWGYIQRGKTDSTRRTIAGTVDQPLYRNQRIDPYAYRFDNVPNGLYQVDLLFAEFQDLRKNRRLYDVIIENTMVLPAHDTDYELGPMIADPHTFFVEVTDQRMDVRLIPRDGYEKPVVNALRVIHRVDR